MTQEYQIDIKLKESATGKEVFAESYQMALLKTFVNNTNPKEHGFKSHCEGFLTLLKKNCLPLAKRSFRKFQIYTVDYNMGVGSEIMSSRPSILYKKSEHTLGEDVIVIPLTSALQQKQTDAFDVLVNKDETNLFQNSFARIRQMRSVSVKRLGKLIGEINDDGLKHKIDSTVAEMLGTNQ